MQVENSSILAKRPHDAIYVYKCQYLSKWNADPLLKGVWYCIMYLA